MSEEVCDSRCECLSGGRKNDLNTHNLKASKTKNISIIPGPVVYFFVADARSCLIHETYSTQIAATLKPSDLAQ